MDRKVFLWFYILIFRVIFASDDEDSDTHYQKCKEFEKVMGKPSIYYDENKDLVMLIRINKGGSNRVIDSGINSVGIQLKAVNGVNANDELITFLSQVLGVKESSFTVHPGEKPFHVFVKVQGTGITAYEVIDKLVAALEVTAREEPSALCVTDSLDLESLNQKRESQGDDLTKEFVWPHKLFT